jgi:hypothetical protein
VAPLEGIRVIDMTGIVFGPVATQALADWGADAIKVEPPEGDTLRHAGVARHRGMSAIFLNLKHDTRVGARRERGGGRGGWRQRLRPPRANGRPRPRRHPTPTTRPRGDPR